MNENCKYCKNAKTCLENAEYNSIYCQLHKRIPKVIGKTYEELLEENQQLKEQLEASEKARKDGIEYIKSNPNVFYDEYLIDVETVIKNENYNEIVGEINFISKLKNILDIDKGE